MQIFLDCDARTSYHAHIRMIEDTKKIRHHFLLQSGQAHIDPSSKNSCT